MAITRRGAVIFDKDGTLIENVPYNVDPARIWLAPGAGEALRLLRSYDYALMVASNQSGIARGYFTEDAITAVCARLEMLVTAEGAHLDGSFYCPHHPDGCVDKFRVHCGCRKPAPGLLLRAAAVAGVPVESCWMIGDILDDIEAGRRAGMRTILINNGNETEWRLTAGRTPHHTARDLTEAARVIIADHGPAGDNRPLLAAEGRS